MTTLDSSPPPKPPNWLSRFVKEHGFAAAFFLAAGGAIFGFVIWVSNAIIRYDTYIEENYEAKIQELESKVQAQQGKIDAHQKWIDCQELQEKQATTGKKYVVIWSSTYDCVEEIQMPSEGAQVPAAQSHR